MTDIQIALLSLCGALMIIFIVWPDTKALPTEAYLRVLSPTEWKEECDIYEAVLKIHPMLDLQTHHHTLERLCRKGKAEKFIPPSSELKETWSPDSLNRTYLDHVQPFTLVTETLYRRIPQSGGRRRRTPLIPVMKAT